MALGLAAALGRTLILPPVTCGYDKAWYALDRSGAFSGAPKWIVPIRNCPLDHYIEPGELTRRRDGPPSAVGGHVREWSLLSNPRMPPAMLAAAAEVELVNGGAPTELERLRREFGSTKVLLVTNLPQHDLWRSGLLGNEVRRELAKRFPYVSGGWCCAPEDDKKRGLPNSHSFHLNIPKPGPEDIARGRLGSDAALAKVTTELVGLRVRAILHGVSEGRRCPGRLGSPSAASSV
eukprot:scaffold36489_cov60-Phaeocystis_antarctica.AAC.1